MTLRSVLPPAQNGFDDTFQIRGFPVGPGDVGLNGLYGLVAPNRVPSHSSSGSNCSRVPGALINGIAPGGSVGGGVNIVTKRAGEIPFTRVTPFFMSAGNYGLHLENSGRYGENKEWGVRFNGVGRNGEASIDDGNWRIGLGALGLDYRGERFRWTLDAISQNDDTRNFRPQMGIQTTVPFIPAVPDARSNWYPGTARSSATTPSRRQRIRHYRSADGLCRDRLSRGRTSRRSLIPVSPGSPAAWTSSAISGSSMPTTTSTARRRAAMSGIRSRFQIGPVGHAVNFAFTGYYQENGNAYVPTRRPSRCRRTSTIRHRFRWSPARASAAKSQRYHAQELRDCGHDVVPERYGPVHCRCPSPEGGTGCFQHHHRCLDEQLRSRSDHASRRPCRQAVAECLAVRELRRRPEPGYHRPQSTLQNRGEILAPYKSKQQEAGSRWIGAPSRRPPPCSRSRVHS